MLLAGGNVEVEDLLATLAQKIDRRNAPYAKPLREWTEERFLRALAEHVLRRKVVPEIVASWLAALAPEKPETPSPIVKRLQEAVARHAAASAPPAPQEPAGASKPAASRG
jgi:hypothetical protein